MRKRCITSVFLAAALALAPTLSARADAIFEPAARPALGNTILYTIVIVLVTVLIAVTVTFVRVRIKMKRNKKK